MATSLTSRLLAFLALHDSSVRSPGKHLGHEWAEPDLPVSRLGQGAALPCRRRLRSKQVRLDRLPNAGRSAERFVRKKDSGSVTRNEEAVGLARLLPRPIMRTNNGKGPTTAKVIAFANQ